MDRDRLRVAAVAVLAILALAAGAATLDAVTSTGGGMGPSDSGDTGLDEDEGDSPLPSDDEGDDGFLFDGQRGSFGCYDTLREPRTVLALVAGLAVGALLIRRRYDSMVSLAFLMSIGLPGAVFYLLLAACPTRSGERDGLLPGGGDLPEGGGMLGDEVGRTVPSTPSLLLLALLLLTFLLAAAVIVSGTDDEEVEPEHEVEEPDERAAAVAAAAGRAADRIEADGDLENEIYRAWREMVGLLDVSNPRATTPGEFADAAGRAGIDRSDVDELTDLFEDVRYGGFEPTEERERRAVEALRRIETEYEEG